MIATYRAAMDEGLHTNKTVLSNYKPPFAVDWAPFLDRNWTDAVRHGDCRRRRSRRSVDKLTEVPASFKLHPRVEKVIADRRAMGRGQAAARLGHGREPGLRVAC